MAKKQSFPPWWLEHGTEICPACSQSYAYQTEIRCFDCDGPMCPVCVQVTTTLEVSCPTCFDCGVSESEVRE